MPRQESITGKGIIPPLFGLRVVTDSVSTRHTDSNGVREMFQWSVNISTRDADMHSPIRLCLGNPFTTDSPSSSLHHPHTVTLLLCACQLQPFWFEQSTRVQELALWKTMLWSHQHRKTYDSSPVQQHYPSPMSFFLLFRYFAFWIATPLEPSVLYLTFLHPYNRNHIGRIWYLFGGKPSPQIFGILSQPLPCQGRINEAFQANSCIIYDRGATQPPWKTGVAQPPS